MTKVGAEIRETIYRLDGPLRWSLGEPYELIRKVALRAGDTVLDVGAGTGFLSLPLARAVGPDGGVHCVDLCGALLEVLEGKARKSRLLDRMRLQEGSALRLDQPSDRFDFVFSSYLLHELGDDAPTALREMHRVLKPLGQLVLADFRKLEEPERCAEIEAWYGAQADGGGVNERHLRFSLADMERMLLAAGFQDIRLETWVDFHMHVVARK